MTGKNSHTWLVKIFHLIYHHTEGFLLFVLTILLVTDVLLGILARYVRFEIVFATELGKYLFIWLCAIGISAAAKDKVSERLYSPLQLAVTGLFVSLITLLQAVYAMRPSSRSIFQNNPSPWLILIQNCPFLS